VVAMDAGAGDGGAGILVAILEFRLTAGKAGVEGDTGGDVEGAITSVVRLAVAFVGIVAAGGNPDFVTIHGAGQGILQAGVGVGPGTAVIGAASVTIHVNDAALGLGCMELEQ